MIAGFQTPNSDITVNYNPVGSGPGQERPPDQDVDFAGTDSLPKPDELSSYQGGALLNFPTVAAPITVSYNLSSVKTLQARRRRRSPRSSRSRSRSGTTRRSPPTTPASRCPRPRSPSRTAPTARARRRNFTKFLDRRRPDRLDARQRRHRRLDVAARHDAGRQQEHRRRADRARRPTARSATSTSPTRRRRSCRPRRSRTRPASSSRRPSTGSAAARREHDAQRRPVVRPDQRAGRGQRTRSPRRRGSSCTRSRPSHDTGTALKAFLQYIYGDGQALANDRRLRRAPGVVRAEGRRRSSASCRSPRRSGT